MEVCRDVRKAVSSAMTDIACWRGRIACIVLDFVSSNISEHIDFVCVYLSSVAGCAVSAFGNSTKPYTPPPMLGLL